MSMPKPKGLLILPLLILGATAGYSQEPVNNLVISQVSLSTTEPERNWIEVYNPSDKPLWLERLRLSHFRTVNILPESVQKNGGIKVPAGGNIVICADEAAFSSLYGNDMELTVVPALLRLADGGFIVIATQGGQESRGCFVRYGKPGMSSKVSGLAGGQVVGFSEKGRSFRRELAKTIMGINLKGFVESPAVPGRRDK